MKNMWYGVDQQRRAAGVQRDAQHHAVERAAEQVERGTARPLGKPHAVDELQQGLALVPGVSQALVDHGAGQIDLRCGRVDFAYAALLTAPKERAKTVIGPAGFDLEKRGIGRQQQRLLLRVGLRNAQGVFFDLCKQCRDALGR
jgi:hypothetical protein